MDTQTAPREDQAIDEATGGMIVGIDGSPTSLAALRWAAAAPAEWGQIVPFAAWRMPLWQSVLAGSTAAVVWAELEHAADRGIDHVIEQLSDAERDRLAERVVVEGDTVAALTAEADAFDLLVVGTRGRGAVADTLLGSVSVDCVGRATTPVAVVPEDVDLDGDGPVVVGIDGSPNSAAAVRWALENTAEGVPIVAVGAWTFVIHGTLDSPPIMDDLTEDDTRRLVEGVVERVCAEVGRSPDDVEIDIRRTDPRVALDAASKDARMLVLGARGVHGWAFALLGSVTTAMVHQPRVPTVVVPAD